MKIRKFRLISFTISVYGVFFKKVSSKVVSSEIISLPEGQLQFHYDDDIRSDPCDTVVMINVGTAMRVTSYNDLGRSIVSSTQSQLSVIAIIIDNNPRRIEKQNGKKYADLANSIVQNLKQIVPICSNTKDSAVRYLIGGHSGGGAGAINALTSDPPLFSFEIAGIVGLAPFPVDPRSPMKILAPSLMWGFSNMTCLVLPHRAALAAYNISSPNRRIFYQVQTEHQEIATEGPHCSFADDGCLGMCSGGSQYSWIRNSGVGDSVCRFITAIRCSNFSQSQFKINQSDVEIFVNRNYPISDSTPYAESEFLQNVSYSPDILPNIELSNN